MLEEPKAKSKPVVRKQLNERQVEVLQVLYKFRFATAQLISTYQNQNTWTSNVRLQNLVEQEYLGRNFDASFHSKHLAATYFLLPKGIKYLNKHTEVNESGLRLNYNSRRVKPEFTTHALRVFRLYLKLDDLLLDDLEFYSSTELAGQSVYPAVRPDAYLRFTGLHAGLPHCMLDIVEGSSSKAKIKKQVMRFFEHYESGTGWGEAYPNILLVCDSPELESLVRAHVSKELTERGLPRPKYYTTTLKALHGIAKETDAVWADVRNAESPRVSFRGM